MISSNEVTMAALEHFRNHIRKTCHKASARRQPIAKYVDIYNECETQIRKLAQQGVKRHTQPNLLMLGGTKYCEPVDI